MHYPSYDIHHSNALTGIYCDSGKTRALKKLTSGENIGKSKKFKFDRDIPLQYIYILKFYFSSCSWLTEIRSPKHFLYQNAVHKQYIISIFWYVYMIIHYLGAWVGNTTYIRLGRWTHKRSSSLKLYNSFYVPVRRWTVDLNSSLFHDPENLYNDLSIACATRSFIDAAD